MNKKFFATLLVVLMFFVAFPAFCGGEKENTVVNETESVVQETTPVKVEESAAESASVGEVQTSTLSAPVARVTYGESTYTIKQNEVDALIASAKESSVELSKENATLNLISQLLLQMKLNELVSGYSQDELSQIGLYAIANEAMNYYGIELKEQEDFENYCKSYHNTDLESYWAYSLQNYVFMSYLYSTYTSVFEEYSLKDEYVTQAYNSAVSNNPNAFAAGPFASVKHILFAFSENEPKSSTLERANQTLLNIKSGAVSFEEAAAMSDDPSTKDQEGLVPGYAEKDSDILNYYFGSDASAVIFSLNVGDISKIVEGPLGYHIFKLIDVVDETVLKLDDPLNPGSEETLRDYLAYQVSQQLEEEAYQVAQNKLISDLLAAAEIKYFN